MPANTWALVPLRDLAAGKERLAPALDAAARRSLVEAMARDVVAALLDAGFDPGRVLLVSQDPGVAALAGTLGIGLFRPDSTGSDPLNAALREAADHALLHAAASVLMMHADLPAASATALRELLRAHRERNVLPGATLVADRAGSGTNCLLVSPPACLALGFGADSRRRHREAAAAAGVDYREFTHAGLGLDVDLPEDLRALVQAAQTPDNACGAHTRAWLAAHAAL